MRKCRLVLGRWREGFDLGSKLPDEDHFSAAPRIDETRRDPTSRIRGRNQFEAIAWTDEPITNDRWFSNSWVSPYFVIPESTPEGEKQKWRLIHHLSFHSSGYRTKSLNGHIDISEFPTLFPTLRLEHT